MSFEGGYDQIPPMYSAKQIDGKRLYDLARAGITVERRPVHVAISRISIEDMRLPDVTFTVTCAKGTYIRTLCADIGEKLGCGAAMASLERRRVGGFIAEDALTLGRIEQLTLAGEIGPYIVPCEILFLDRLRVCTVPQADRKLYNGNELFMQEIGLPASGAGDLIRVCDSAGRFIAVYRHVPEAGTYRPYRMLN